MTLREALMAADLDKVYALINTRDQGYAEVDGEENPTLAQTTFNYRRVVQELLSKPRVKAYSMPICVHTVTNPGEDKPYTNVSLVNPRYVAPKKGLKPWGGKNPPKGYYNCNLQKHSKYFSIMGIRWSKLIDTPIRLEDNISLEEAIASILWELTFDGWTEEKAAEKTAFIMERIKEAEKEIKEGKCVTLPSSKEGGLKIVIPDCVSQQIMDLVNKKKK